MKPNVVVLDYGSGNVHSAVRMLERIGANVELTADPDRVRKAAGLFVPGVGNFHACAAGLRAANGPALIKESLEAGRPVIGICVGMQVMFDGSTEDASVRQPGLGYWNATVDRLKAPVVPHMGWSGVEAPPGTALFAGVEGERFYFVHSYAASDLDDAPGRIITRAEHGAPFVAAVEDGLLWATQFHPEKSGEAGARLLTNWLATL